MSFSICFGFLISWFSHSLGLGLLFSLPSFILLSFAVSCYIVWFFQLAFLDFPSRFTNGGKMMRQDLFYYLVPLTVVLLYLMLYYFTYFWRFSVGVTSDMTLTGICSMSANPMYVVHFTIFLTNNSQRNIMLRLMIL